MEIDYIGFESDIDIKRIVKSVTILLLCGTTYNKHKDTSHSQLYETVV
jgi:hypothetical protein